jgi:hypothetical protein
LVVWQKAAISAKKLAGGVPSVFIGGSAPGGQRLKRSLPI